MMTSKSWVDRFLETDIAVYRARFDTDRAHHEAAYARMAAEFVDPAFGLPYAWNYDPDAKALSKPSAAAHRRASVRAAFILRAYDPPGQPPLWWFHVSAVSSQSYIDSYYLAEVRPDGPRIIAQGQPCPPCDARGVHPNGVLCETCNGQGWNELVGRKGMPPVDLVALGPPTAIERYLEPESDSYKWFYKKDDPFDWLR